MYDISWSPIDNVEVSDIDTFSILHPVFSLLAQTNSISSIKFLDEPGDIYISFNPVKLGIVYTVSLIVPDILTAPLPECPVTVEPEKSLNDCVPSIVAAFFK